MLLKAKRVRAVIPSAQEEGMVPVKMPLERSIV